MDENDACDADKLSEIFECLKLELKCDLSDSPHDVYNKDENNFLVQNDNANYVEKCIENKLEIFDLNNSTEDDTKNVKIQTNENIFSEKNSKQMPLDEGKISLALIKREIEDIASSANFKKEIESKVSLSVIKKEIEDNVPLDLTKKDILDKISLAIIKKEIKDSVSSAHIRKEIEGNVSLAFTKKDILYTLSLALIVKKIEDKVSLALLEKEIEDEKSSTDFDSSDDENDTILIERGPERNKRRPQKETVYKRIAPKCTRVVLPSVHFPGENGLQGNNLDSFEIQVDLESLTNSPDSGYGSPQQPITSSLPPLSQTSLLDASPIPPISTPLPPSIYPYLPLASPVPPIASPLTPLFYPFLHDVSPVPSIASPSPPLIYPSLPDVSQIPPIASPLPPLIDPFLPDVSPISLNTSSLPPLAQPSLPDVSSVPQIASPSTPTVLPSTIDDDTVLPFGYKNNEEGRKMLEIFYSLMAEEKHFRERKGSEQNHIEQFDSTKTNAAVYPTNEHVSLEDVPDHLLISSPNQTPEEISDTLWDQNCNDLCHSTLERFEQNHIKLFNSTKTNTVVHPTEEHTSLEDLKGVLDRLLISEPNQSPEEISDQLWNLKVNDLCDSVLNSSATVSNSETSTHVANKCPVPQCDQLIQNGQQKINYRLMSNAKKALWNSKFFNVGKYLDELKNILMKIKRQEKKKNKVKVVEYDEREEFKTLNQTNLHSAVMESNVEKVLCIIEVLKSYNLDFFDINNRDANKKTALDYAMEKKMPFLINYLKENNAVTSITV